MVNRERRLSILNRLIEWSLYILIFSLPFSKTMVEICAVVAISSWLLKRSLLRSFKLPRTDLNLPIAAFFFISFLSIFWSTYPDISIKALVRKLTEYLLLYFIVFEAVSEKRFVRNIMRALWLSASIMFIDCIYQKFTGYDFIRGYPMFNLYRVTGAFKFPNGLSAWLLIVIFPFISLALFHKKNSKLRIANSVLAVLLASSLFLTYTRGALISFILALIFLLLLTGKKTHYIAIVFLITGMTIFALILPAQIKDHLGLTDFFTASSSQHRLKMWTGAWRMFMDRPLLGQGLNTFMANYERFRVPGEQGIWYAHNCFLQMAAEIGIFGLLSFLWIIGRIFITSLRSWRLIEDEFLRYIYLGLFCGIVSFLIHSGVESSLYSLKLAVLFYFSLGFLMGIKNLGLRIEQKG